MEKKNLDKIVCDVKNSVKGNAELVRDVTKARYALLQAERQLKKLFFELGTLTYSAHCDESDCAEESARLFEAIAAKRDEVNESRRIYNALCGKVECDHCGKLISVKYDYCPYCGEKVFHEITEDDLAAEDGCTDCTGCNGCEEE